MPHKYTESEVADVKVREEKALAMLKELQLNPAAILSMANIGTDGKDIFATQVQCYLQDTKFKDAPDVVEGAVVSPIQKDELDKKD